MTPPTHCILYWFSDQETRPKTETTGNCLDYHDAKGNSLKCAEAIEKGYCCKHRKTPVL